MPWQTLTTFPWRSSARLLRERFREDRLGVTASSLTFTTVIALVPMLAVALALFTAFPIFAKFQDALQRWLIESLIPDNIARQVMGYLTQFALKASKLGVLGFAALLATVFTLVFTIDRTLNQIWRVRRVRSWPQRLLIYWACITLLPIVLGASLSITSYIVTASRGVVSNLPGGLRFTLDALELLLIAGATAATYHFVPNTRVRWAHAWVGGLLVAAGIELAKKGLTVYLGLVPTYSAVYGAFATVPILLIWIYLAWVIMLMGAVITASLPGLSAGLVWRESTPGWRFQLALDALAALLQVQTTHKGLPLERLCALLRADPQHLEPVLDALVALDWVGQLQEGGEGGPRYVLLVSPALTPLSPLVERLLLMRTAGSAAVWHNARLHELRLSEALPQVLPQVTPLTPAA